VIAFRPATFADLSAIGQSMTRPIWRLAQAQMMGGLAWTLWEGERRALIAGLHPFAFDVFEAWLLIAPGARPGRTALARLLMRARSVLPDNILIARVDDGNDAGQRMALLAGFLPLDEHLPGTKLRTWIRKSVT
jgi:hypothetical protein